MQNTSNESKFPWCKDALLTLACLLLVLGFIFRESFEKEKVVFANDAPLGAIQAHAFDEKVGGWSYWQDLNWVGGEFPSAMPNFTKGFFELSLLLGGRMAWCCLQNGTNQVHWCSLAFALGFSFDHFDFRHLFVCSVL